MPTVSFAPYAVPQFLDNAGAPISGGTLETYLAGTSTPAATYADSAGGAANPTTIRLDSAGRPSNEGTLVDIRLDVAKSYKFVLKNAAGATVRTVDNIWGGLPPLSVVDGSIANGAVKTDALADGAVTVDKIFDGAITAQKIIWTAPGILEILEHLSIGSEVAPELFGAKADYDPALYPQRNGTDNTAAFQAALDTGKNINLRGRHYRADTAMLVFKSKSQKIIFNGGSLRAVNLDARGISCELVGPGTLHGPLKWGIIATNVPANSSTITLEPGHNFEVGDFIRSSWGNPTTGVNPLWGNHAGITGNRTITAVNGNTITLSEPTGNLEIVAGVPVGTFVFTTFFVPDRQSSVRMNDMKCRGFYGYMFAARPEGPNMPRPSFYSERSTFDDFGVDQFNVARGDITLIDFRLGRIWDVAKQSIVFGAGAHITLDRGSVARGNYDVDLYGLDVPTDRYDGTERITCRDVIFDGKNALTPAQIYYTANSLCSLPFWGEGPSVLLGSFSFERCEWRNYARNVFGTTYAGLTGKPLTIYSLSFNDCSFNGSLMYWQSDSAIDVRVGNIRACSVFHGAERDDVLLQVSAPSFTRFRVSDTQIWTQAVSQDHRRLQGVALDACRLVSTNPIMVYSDVELNDVTLALGTKLRGAVASNGIPIRGRLIYEGSFANAAGTTDVVALPSDPYRSAYGQANGLTLRSSTGTLTYELRRSNFNTYANAILDIPTSAKVVGGLVGGDWMLGPFPKVSMGGVPKTATYSAGTTLSAAAASGATTITVAAAGTAAVGDMVFIGGLASFYVWTTTISAITGNTITLAEAMPAAAGSGSGVWFLRVA